MLFEKWDLGLNGERDIRESRRCSTVRRHTGEHPGAALLVHQAARAVDWIDEHSPAAVTLLGAKSFGDHTHRFVGGQFTQAPHEGLFRHPVNRVDRVTFVACRRCELLGRLSLARLHDGVADRVMQRKDRLEQFLSAAHSAAPSPPSV